MAPPLLLNTQRYSIHDGPGIRTTLFFKGCPLACPWCHNPESQSFRPQRMVVPSRCTGCGRCEGACPTPQACTGCGRCVPHCPQDARRIAGEPATAEGLMTQILRDRMFYDRSGGGVTLSGGEVMAQDGDFLLDLLTRLKREVVPVAVDTSGQGPGALFRAVAPLTQIFLYDIKLADPQAHRRWTGLDNSLILENLALLSSLGARLHIRIPLIRGVNADDTTLEEMARLLLEYRVEEVTLLPYHDIGRGKWEQLGMAPPQAAFARPSQDQITQWIHYLTDRGLPRVSQGG